MSISFKTYQPTYSLMKRSLLRIGFFISCSLFLSSCYSFKGISIDPAVKTYSIEIFKDRSVGAPVNLPQDFVEMLSQKIRNDSRLNYKDIDSDIVFEGEIRKFKVTPGSVTSGEQLAFNRLTIDVFVKYTNNKIEKDQWEQTFSYYADFSGTDQLLNVQADLIQTISLKLVEDIFNKAFTNW